MFYNLRIPKFTARWGFVVRYGWRWTLMAVGNVLLQLISVSLDFFTRRSIQALLNNPSTISHSVRKKRPIFWFLIKWVENKLCCFQNSLHEFYKPASYFIVSFCIVDFMYYFFDKGLLYLKDSRAEIVDELFPSTKIYEKDQRASLLPPEFGVNMIHKAKSPFS